MGKKITRIKGPVEANHFHDLITKELDLVLNTGAVWHGRIIAADSTSVVIRNLRKKKITVAYSTIAEIIIDSSTSNA